MRSKQRSTAGTEAPDTGVNLVADSLRKTPLEVQPVGDVPELKHEAAAIEFRAADVVEPGLPVMGQFQRFGECFLFAHLWYR